jgi:hypothetical protein
MGYYTRYNLLIKENRSGIDDTEIFNNTVEKLRELDVIDYALDENLEGCDDVKWYESEDNMRKVSTEIQNVVFLLKGEGEESGDVWDEYYLNGKKQRCQVELIFPDFDESKLE